MTFWYDAQIQPKRAYRFLLSVVGQDNSIKQFLIKKVSKPSFTITESEHKYLNHTFYYPGKLTWNEVTFTIVDVIDPVDNASAAVMRMLEQSGYQIPISNGVLSTVSKEKSVTAMGQITIRQIDSEGRNVEGWRLHNAWIKDVKFGELDYSSEEMLNVDVTVRYDNAYYEGLQTGKLPSNAKGPGLL
jgi:hypothetical protein